MVVIQKGRHFEPLHPLVGSCPAQCCGRAATSSGRCRALNVGGCHLDAMCSSWFLVECSNWHQYFNATCYAVDYKEDGLQGPGVTTRQGR